MPISTATRHWLDQQYTTPPVCQGQIVELAYALDGESGIAYCRVTDRSDGAVTYSCAEITDDDLEAWDPSRTEPHIAGEWTSVA